MNNSLKIGITALALALTACSTSKTSDVAPASVQPEKQAATEDVANVSFAVTTPSVIPRAKNTVIAVLQANAPTDDNYFFSSVRIAAHEKMTNLKVVLQNTVTVATPAKDNTFKFAEFLPKATTKQFQVVADTENLPVGVEPVVGVTSYEMTAASSGIKITVDGGDVLRQVQVQ